MWQAINDLTAIWQFRVLIVIGFAMLLAGALSFMVARLLRDKGGKAPDDLDWPKGDPQQPRQTQAWSKIAQADEYPNEQHRRHWSKF